MRVGPWRRGELLVLLGLAGLIATLFLDWFESGSYANGGGAAFVVVRRGWTELGHPWFELLVLFALALAMVLATAARSRRGRPTYGAMVALVLSIPLGALVLLTTIVRVLLVRPGLDTGDGTLRIDPALGGYVGVASVLVALVGLWVAMADDRTAAPASAYEPPAPRPVPALRPDEPGTTPPSE